MERNLRVTEIMKMQGEDYMNKQIAYQESDRGINTKRRAYLENLKYIIMVHENCAQDVWVRVQSENMKVVRPRPLSLRVIGNQKGKV